MSDNRFFKPEWNCDVNDWLLLTRRQQNTIIQMFEKSKGRPMDANSDKDIKELMIETAIYRKLFADTVCPPSAPPSPIHMWSPIASPQR